MANSADSDLPSFGAPGDPDSLNYQSDAASPPGALAPGQPDAMVITEGEPEKKSRAGRNLPAAIGVGLGLLALLALTLAFRPEPFVAFLLLAVTLGLIELKGAMANAELDLPQVPLLIGGFALPLAAYIWGATGLLVAFIVMAGLIAAWVALRRTGRAADLTASLFALMYAPFLASFVMLIFTQPRGALRVALLILLAVANDTGGYIAGVLFGKHPMAPSVSPKKSWEGFVGSVLLTTLIAILGGLFVLGMPFLPGGGTAFLGSALGFGLLLGVLSAMVCTVGDLSESLLKRDIGVKDMGHLLPGHGGVLDRLDSILIIAPFVFIVFQLVARHVA